MTIIFVVTVCGGSTDCMEWGNVCVVVVWVRFGGESGVTMFRFFDVLGGFRDVTGVDKSWSWYIMFICEFECGLLRWWWMER